MKLQTLRAQAADALRTLIDESYEPGQRLPPEPDLAKRMGLSRNTIREAIGELVAEGRLERKWGVGTTVLAPREQAMFSLMDLGPIPRIIERSGQRPGLLRFRLSASVPPELIAGMLSLPPGASALHVERLFTINDEPAVRIQHWTPTEVAGVSLDLTGLADMNVDLPTLIREQTKIPFDRMDGRIDAILSPEEFPHPAGVPTPLVQISQTIVARDDTPLTYTIIQYDTSLIDLTLQRAANYR